MEDISYWITRIILGVITNCDGLVSRLISQFFSLININININFVKMQEIQICAHLSQYSGRKGDQEKSYEFAQRGLKIAL